ncbi:peptidylprolyl isomerase [Paenibacillus sp. R14(2021)]|uniref:peptidylprolyl isomerase n=1 Tax=Paenibacillus sp. R14(2021) TaxID=2859228 RepID=UPI00215724AD|nr:peptidylprolyl isomerase [Paenibacillus sp. R14(2021)]
MNERDNDKDLKKENELQTVENENQEGVRAIETPDEPEDDRSERDTEDEKEASREHTEAHQPASKPAGSGGKAWMYISLGLALILLIVLVKPPFGGSASKDAVGSVNGVAITKDRLYDEMVKLGGAQTMDNLIQDELVKQEADKAGIAITDADVDKEIANIKKRFPTEADFQSALQQASMTLDDLKKQTPMQLRIRKILEPQVKVTDKDIEDYFNQNKAQYDEPEQVKASHILVATKAEAEAVIKQLKDGGDFAQIAKEKSTDPGSKDKGGDLGFFGKGAMDPAFEKAAFALKVGEMTTEPVQSQYGYHIIKVTDRKEAKTATLAEKKEEIKEQIIQSKISELSTTWLEDLKKKSQITNTLKKDDQEAAGAPDTGANNAVTSQ